MLMNHSISLATIVLCQTMASTEMGPPVPTPAVSPNQAATIEETVDLNPAPATVAEASVKEDNANKEPAAKDGLIPVAIKNKASEADDRTRMMRRGMASLDGMVGPSEKQIPWYRTGWGSLIVVLSLLALLAALARRFFPTARIAESGALRVVARSAISTKHSVALIQFGRRFLLLGMSPEGIQCLSEVSESTEVAELLVRLSTAGGSSRNLVQTEFEELLRTESREYQEPISEIDSSPSNAAKENAVKGKPLHDLLNRLHQLQARFSNEEAIRPSQLKGTSP
ncbi:MAG: flagellar biosynthetic protein FliO [Planctomycetota bacterium]